MAAIEAEGLQKHYGDVRALDGVSLRAEEGTVLGLLGPNGAGKTTAVRILTTLLRPDRGSARVNGMDIVKDATELRRHIGLAGQYAAVDEALTGEENLELFGRLYGMQRAEARKRAAELLERFELDRAAKRVVGTYSGGMRRRLDLAGALVARPPVLFLDEPTTGLDPRSRLSLWDTISDRVASGTTVLLTTQYLEEADRLADEIVVLDHGRVAAAGTPAELKSRIGGERLEVTVPDGTDLAPTIEALRPFTDADPVADDDRVVAPIRADTRLIEVVRGLDDAGIDAIDIHRREATLDDVFLTLTGAARRENEEVAA
jgi:ABC-2 type transport system ATP-binding protein